MMVMSGRRYCMRRTYRCWCCCCGRCLCIVATQKNIFVNFTIITYQKHIKYQIKMIQSIDLKLNWNLPLWSIDEPIADEAFFNGIWLRSSVLDSLVLLLSDGIKPSAVCFVWPLIWAINSLLLQIGSFSLCWIRKCFIKLGLRFTTFSQNGHVNVIFSWTVRWRFNSYF